MKVLVLTLSFGSGHVRAAEAVADELGRQAPDSKVMVVDALAECRWLFRTVYVWPYWLMLRYAPGLWDRFSTARVNQKHEGTAPVWAFRAGCPKVFSIIESFDPDLIVAAEVAACEMAERVVVGLPISMGGGMGPTRMDQVVEQLGESNTPMHILAIAGRDKRVLRKLERAKVKTPVSLQVLAWTDEVAGLMQTATLLVTKPGGLTISEAALCSLPVVFFDPIPGAEFVNARRMVDAGAAVIAQGPVETARVIVSLLQDNVSTEAMTLRSNKMARPTARRDIARLALSLLAPVKEEPRRMTA